MNQKLWMLILSAVLVTIALLLAVPAQPQSNCWNQFTTENAAIEGCEK